MRVNKKAECSIAKKKLRKIYSTKDTRFNKYENEYNDRIWNNGTN